MYLLNWVNFRTWGGFTR